MASKRLNKRQAREQQELEELAAAKAVAPSAAAAEAESEEEEAAAPAPAKPAAASIFAALNAGEDGDENEDDDDDDGDSNVEAEAVATPTTKKKKNKKKKKKSKAAKPVGEGEEGQDGEAAAPTAPATTSSKKNKKAGGDKATNAAAKGISDMSLDDFDSLLSSQPHMKAGGGNPSAAGPSNAAASSSSSASPSSSLRSSLSLSPSHLDPSVELKRQFGSAAIKAFEASNGGTDGGEGGGGAGAGRAARGTRARMMARNPNLKARSILVQPRGDWPPIARTFTGIQGETVDAGEDGEKVATWTHSKSYLTAQYEFQAAVATYDPNSLYALFRPYPWHIHLLSSLSDIARHQGDLSQAADWNARILFAFERTAAPQWVGSLTGPSGPMRVDFDKVENRALWLAAHRNVGFLGRRGTWRTALEWSKLMLALDPKQDPHGALLWIDFLAVKSGQHAWFVDEFLPALEKSGSNARNWLGGLAFAEALAVRAIEADAAKKKNSSAAARPTSAPSSTELLKRAITRHSYMLPALASKLSLPPLPPSLANIEVDGIHEILAQLYALRSGESLWKDAENKEWLSATLRDFESEKGQPQQSPAQPSDLEAQGIYRHVIASDLPDALRTSLLSCLPRAVGRDEANLNAHDPLPPPKTRAGVTRIDEDYFAPMFRTTGGASSSSRGVPAGQDDSEIGEGIMNRLAAFAAGRLRGWFQQQEGGGRGGEENAGQEEGAPGEMQEALMAALGSLPEAEREAMRRIIEEGAAGMGGPHGEGEGSEGSEDEGDEEEYEEVLSSDDEERR